VTLLATVETRDAVTALVGFVPHHPAFETSCESRPCTVVRGWFGILLILLVVGRVGSAATVAVIVAILIFSTRGLSVVTFASHHLQGLLTSFIKNATKQNTNTKFFATVHFSLSSSLGSLSAVRSNELSTEVAPAMTMRFLPFLDLTLLKTMLR